MHADAKSARSNIFLDVVSMIREGHERPLVVGSDRPFRSEASCPSLPVMRYDRSKGTQEISVVGSSETVSQL